MKHFLHCLGALGLLLAACTSVHENGVGYLSFRASGNTLVSTTINGKPWAKAAPFENVKFPAGSYAFQLKDLRTFHEKTMYLTIRPAKLVSVQTAKMDRAP